MFNFKKKSELQTIVDAYAKKLGKGSAPTVRVVPGAQCSYHSLTHKIEIGHLVLKYASVDTCMSIIAHEVGHSQQPALRKYRKMVLIYAFTLLACAVLPLIGWLLHLTSNMPWMIFSILAPWVPLVYAKSIEPSDDAPDDDLNREFDADDCSCRLVGYIEAYNALIEYTQLFNFGRHNKESYLRLNRLKALIEEKGLAKFAYVD